MTNELIEVIKRVKEKITDDSDMVWTRYDNAEELRNELETYSEELRKGNTSCLNKLYLLFLPTASLQEHSISNNWTDDYLELSRIIDRLHP